MGKSSINRTTSVNSSNTGLRKKMGRVRIRPVCASLINAVPHRTLRLAREREQQQQSQAATRAKICGGLKESLPIIKVNEKQSSPSSLSGYYSGSSSSKSSSPNDSSACSSKLTCSLEHSSSLSLPKGSINENRINDKIALNVSIMHNNYIPSSKSNLLSDNFNEGRLRHDKTIFNSSQIPKSGGSSSHVFKGADLKCKSISLFSSPPSTSIKTAVGAKIRSCFKESLPIAKHNKKPSLPAMHNMQIPSSEKCGRKRNPSLKGSSSASSQIPSSTHVKVTYPNEKREIKKPKISACTVKAEKKSSSLSSSSGYRLNSLENPKKSGSANLPVHTLPSPKNVAHAFELALLSMDVPRPNDTKSINIPNTRPVCPSQSNAVHSRDLSLAKKQQEKQQQSQAGKSCAFKRKSSAISFQSQIAKRQKSTDAK